MPFLRKRQGRVGDGDLGISPANLLLIVELVVQAAKHTRRSIHGGGRPFDENKITIELHKDIVRLMRRHGYEHMWFVPEASLNNPRGELGKVEGRIDLQVIFAERLRPEEYYFGIECKRLRPGDTGTYRYYVDAGVGKFASGVYSPGHPMGMLVGYLMGPADGSTLDDLSRRIGGRYPGAAPLRTWRHTHYRDTEIGVGSVPRVSGRPLDLLHAVVRMHP